MTVAYQFEEYMARAKDALVDGQTDTAMDWVSQALSFSKHLEPEPLAKAHYLKAQILISQEEYGQAEKALKQTLDLFRWHADAHLLLGELMILDGRDDAAATALESALGISPENVDARCLLIFCYAQRGNHHRAKEQFDQCVEQQPDRGDSYHHMGISLWRQGSSDAVEYFEKALSRDPVLSGPHYYLGRMKIAENHLAGAQDQFQKDLELNPANSLAELELIRAYLLNLPWHEAAELFEKHFPPEVFCEIPVLHQCHFHFNYELLEQKFRLFVHAIKEELPQTPENLFRLAKIYRHKSFLGDAIEHLKMVLESDKQFRPAYTELADIYRLQDEVGRACEVLENATALFGDAEAYSALGRALLSCGRSSEAEETVKKALSLNPQLAEPYFLLGVILANKASRTPNPEHLMDEARASLHRALKIDPDHTSALAYLMEVALRQEDYDQCIAIADGRLNDDPHDQLALWYSGRCLRAKENWTAAEDRLVKLLELRPDDAAARETLTEVYQAQERFGEAAEQLELAIDVPGRRPQPGLLLRLAEIYSTNLNEREKARQHLVRFLQTTPPGHPDFDRAKRLLEEI